MSEERKVTYFTLSIPAIGSAEAVSIICREFIRIFLQDKATTTLCAAHARIHPEFHSAVEPPGLCVLCGAGLKETEGLASL